jgi:hypothetical protein
MTPRGGRPRLAAVRPSFGAIPWRDVDMGAIADAIVAYTQPLIDSTDGSMEQMNNAMALGQACWNLALLPEDQRDQVIGEMRSSLQMGEDEFNDFRRSVIDPMIQRHYEMFPQMHGRSSMQGQSLRDPLPGAPSQTAPTRTRVGEAYPGTEPYAPCPCGSGKKYKFCCRAKGH